MSKTAKMPKATKILLEGGTSDTDRKFLNIAPTPHSITHEGRKYFRCPKSMGQDPEDGQWGMLYLWDGWGAWKLAQTESQDAEGRG